MSRLPGQARSRGSPGTRKAAGEYAARPTARSATASVRSLINRPTLKKARQMKTVPALPVPPTSTHQFQPLILRLSEVAA